MKTIMATLIVSGILATSVRADLLVHEPFDYPTGTLSGASGGIGFGGNWSTSSGNVNVSATVLSYTDNVGNVLPTSGNTLYVDRSSRTGTRALDQTYNAGLLWVSLLIQPAQSRANDDGGNFRFTLMTSSTSDRLAFGNLSNAGDTYRMSIGGQTAISDVSIQNNDVSFAVIRYDIDNGQVHLFLNPANLALEPDLSEATLAITGLGAMSFNRIGTITSASNPSGDTSRSRARFDEIRIGETYYDVTATEIIPEPASLALVGLGGLMLLGRRSRR